LRAANKARLSMRRTIDLLVAKSRQALGLPLPQCAGSEREDRPLGRRRHAALDSGPHTTSLPPMAHGARTDTRARRHERGHPPSSGSRAARTPDDNRYRAEMRLRSRIGRVAPLANPQVGSSKDWRELWREQAIFRSTEPNVNGLENRQAGNPRLGFESPLPLRGSGIACVSWRVGAPA
jgi:hypothetical protein